MQLVIEDDMMIVSGGQESLKVHYEPSIPASYVVAMRDVASHVGCHSLTSLRVANDRHQVPVDRLLNSTPVTSLR
ncbi:hypothetical protein AAVH_30600, partial [Aphelenchoides avenae]